MSLSVASLQNAKIIQKLSGIRYAGQKLFIRMDQNARVGSHSSSNPVQNKPTTSINDAFTALIQSRYNQNAKYLNMDSIMSDPGIQQTGIDIFHHESSTRLGNALCKMI